MLKSRRRSPLLAFVSLKKKLEKPFPGTALPPHVDTARRWPSVNRNGPHWISGLLDIQPPEL